MARIVNMHEAKTQLSRLVAAAVDGEEVVIAKAGKPMAKLVRYDEPPRRERGGWEGRVWTAPDFDEYDDELRRLFDGREDES